MSDAPTSSSSSSSSSSRRTGIRSFGESMKLLSAHLYMCIMFAVVGAVSLVLFIVTRSGLWLVLLAGSATLTVVVFLTRPTYSRAARLAIARGDRKKKVNKKVTIDVDLVAPVTCNPCGESCSICLGEFYAKRKGSSSSSSSSLASSATAASSSSSSSSVVINPVNDLSISSASTISSIETVATNFDPCEVATAPSKQVVVEEECCCRTLPCGHSYHGKCLVEWIKHEGDDFSCPLCRWKPTATGVEGTAICAAV
ncbi:hypothetical protein FOZ61_000167 [Perkinsus olseni]|uniref:RING-type domain-containing protein n=1 Tax=Perkinsus olseni TaxID=32597 RepID=A0A7J6M0T0_PEROL|nr:hypothetical protein FOZ61_000167 [Perkinsus olseni]